MHRAVEHQADSNRFADRMSYCAPSQHTEALAIEWLETYWHDVRGILPKQSGREVRTRTG